MGIDSPEMIETKTVLGTASDKDSRIEEGQVINNIDRKAEQSFGE